jgi:hypothetical protein
MFAMRSKEAQPSVRFWTNRPVTPDCGTEKEVSSSRLRRGPTVCCGCSRPRLPPCISGERFGRLTVLHEAPRRQRARYAAVRCDCGMAKEVAWGHLISGRTVSCGCILRKGVRPAGTRHQPLYGVWMGMRVRCRDPRAASFANYGRRGIRVCDRWQVFENFRDDMAASWRLGLTLDRIDNDGNYAPGNCRWATRAEQARNRRDTVIVGTPWGSICLKDAARFSGISYATIQRRRRAGRDLLAPPRR